MNRIVNVTTELPCAFGVPRGDPNLMALDCFELAAYDVIDFCQNQDAERFQDLLDQTDAILRGWGPTGKEGNVE